jgi:heme/copper-type cytochrome/quinol oxidase subunit 1
MFWFFAHPEVYIVFIPATGFISDIIPTFARRPIFGYTALVLSLIATAFIGFGVWVHHMFATPLPRLGQGLFTASSLMIVVPTPCRSSAGRRRSAPAGCGSRRR